MNCGTFVQEGLEYHLKTYIYFLFAWLNIHGRVKTFRQTLHSLMRYIFYVTRKSVYDSRNMMTIINYSKIEKIYQTNEIDT